MPLSTDYLSDVHENLQVAHIASKSTHVHTENAKFGVSFVICFGVKQITDMHIDALIHTDTHTEKQSQKKGFSVSGYLETCQLIKISF